MNSLTAKNRLPQLRMIPVPGLPLFRYERRVANRWVACNHSRAMAIVGVWRRKGESLCVKSTGDSGTTAASRFGLSGGSQRPDASYTCEMGTSMNASALSISSSANLQS